MTDLNKVGPCPRCGRAQRAHYCECGHRPEVTTPDPVRAAEIGLDAAAQGFVASVRDSDVECYLASRAYLYEMANAYAGALGNLSAAERRELAALGRFRGGIIALRAELSRMPDLQRVLETIDALIALGPP